MGSYFLQILYVIWLDGGILNSSLSVLTSMRKGDVIISGLILIGEEQELTRGDNGFMEIYAGRGR